VSERLDVYLQLLSESEIVTEDVRSFLLKLTTGKLAKMRDSLSKALRKKDKKLIKKAIFPIPVVSDDKLKHMAKKFVPKFDLPYKVAKRHIKSKYPRVPDNVATHVATMVGTIAGREDNPDEKAKEFLKKFDNNLKKALRGGSLTEQDIGAPKMWGEGFVSGFGLASLATFLIGWLAVASPPIIITGIILLSLSALLAVETIFGKSVSR
jgi:hypothetical protein